MKLYYSPGACSLADHIALLEGGLEFTLERVDLKSKLTETGADFLAINPKGYVPALLLDSGEVVTENVAVLDWIATRAPALAPRGELGRTRLLEALAYISSELHKGFKPWFSAATQEARQQAQTQIVRRLRWLADRKVGHYLFGNEPGVADFYLFVMLRWAGNAGIAVPDTLAALHDRMLDRPQVRAAIQFEEMPAPRARSL
jgi:glutathione S-transferase